LTQDYREQYIEPGLCRAFFASKCAYRRTEHGRVADPHKIRIAVRRNDAERAFAFDDCFRMLNQRISIFVNLLLDKLSKLSLQKQLDEIGPPLS
jgi:hypothetical protein